MPDSRAFAPGFRLSLLDVAVLICGAIATAVILPHAPWLALGISFVVLHFFLFCNVFRVARLLELAWAAWFVLLVSFTAIWTWPGWIAAALLALAGTIVVVAIEMRKPSYHGVGWRWINPGLQDWWLRNVTAPSLPPTGRSVGSLAIKDLVGRAIVGIRQVCRSDANGLDWAVTFYVLDTGVIFTLPQGEANCVSLEEPPVEAEDFYMPEIEPILRKPIRSLHKQIEDGDVLEHTYVLLQDETLFTDVMAAPHGTGDAGIHIYPPGEFDRSQLVPLD
jgi:hypothetical protein